MGIQNQFESVVRAHSPATAPRSMQRCGWIPHSNDTVRLDPGHWSKAHRRTPYVTAPDGVRIYSPQGHLLGTITAPRSVHNIAWGGEDGRTLYLCASDRLYRINLLVEGVRP